MVILLFCVGCCLIFFGKVITDLIHILDQAAFLDFGRQLLILPLCEEPVLIYGVNELLNCVKGSLAPAPVPYPFIVNDVAELLVGAEIPEVAVTLNRQTAFWRPLIGNYKFPFRWRIYRSSPD